MTGQGQIFASGISIVLTAPGTSLLVPAANGALKYLLLVDSAGDPIVPVYEATTVDGVAMAGVRIALPSFTDLSALDTRVTTAESDINGLEDITTALGNDIGGVDTRLTVQENLGGTTDVTWAASVTLDWSSIPTRHAKLTTTSSTSLTFNTPVGMVEGLDYAITLDNSAQWGPTYTFPDGNSWDVESPPWNIIFGGPIPQFNSDPEVFTFTFRYIGGKMRLINACFGNDA